MPNTTDEPMPIYDRKNEEDTPRDAGGAENQKPNTYKAVGISRFNAFSDVDDFAREARSRRMRRKMGAPGYPMTGDGRTWI